jgi:hypothetical protein
MSLTPMVVTSVHHLVERAYKESSPRQYLRELLRNSLEAGATRVEFGPEWQAVSRRDVYRLMVADNGKGMDPDDLLKFLNTFGGGGKPIGDAHENFGIGAKTSLLPWNRAGVVVISWTPACPDGAMVWLMYDPVSKEYGAKKFETINGNGDSTYDSVVKPFAEWSDVKPKWIQDHGTVVVCLGNNGTEDTFLGRDGEDGEKAITVYLNKRFWDLPGNTEIWVQELRCGKDKRARWPRSLADASGTSDRRWNRRQVRGAQYLVWQVRARGDTSTNVKKIEVGSVTLRDGTIIEWYLWKGERPGVHSYGYEKGYITALYQSELYDTQQHPAQFRSFGVTHKMVRDNLTLVAKPPLSGPDTYGVYPDSARSTLKVQGTKRAGEPLPWAEWGQEFAENMPQAISDAMNVATPEHTGTLDDGKWRKRLASEFSKRWTVVRYVHRKGGPFNINTTLRGQVVLAEGPQVGRGSAGKAAQPSLACPKKTTEVFEPRADRPIIAAREPTTKTGVEAVKMPSLCGLPEYEWVTCADINGENKRAYAASWVKPNKDHPTGVIQLARDHTVMAEVKKYWRDMYPAKPGEKVDAIVEEVYGEVMVARVAHSEHFMGDPNWGRNDVEEQLRSPAALTMSMLGLFSEDSILTDRMANNLGGRRRKDTAA